MYQGRMAHLKAMLIDDEYLIVGSSNFDFLSSELMQEIVAVITHRQTIAEFRERVLDVDLKNTIPNEEKVSHLRGLYHISQLKLMPILVGAVEKIVTFGR
jgi:cardiolipin synthase